MLPSAHQSNPSLLVVECGLAAIALAASFAWPQMGAGGFARAERALGRLAELKGWAVAAAGLSLIALRLAILPLCPIPLRFIPDDFSFLLAADTFAHGRLTNPTPAMWTHFETIHETMQPTYQSMYFPGQGLLLAAGQVLFGQPWFAVLISSALMCAALTWALQAWLPSRWAFVGGMIAVIRLGLFSLWTNTYHTGGSLAALGGALVLGALPRLTRTARFRYALLMAIGMAILGLTRPYEGMLLCLPVVFVVGSWAWKGKNRPPVTVLARRAALPLAIVVGAGAWLGYYDLEAFGKATTLPYTIDHATYGAPPYYIWQQPSPAPHYRHDSLRLFYQDGGDRHFFDGLHSVKGFLPNTLLKISLTVLFYAGFTLLLPLLVGWRAFLDRRIRFAIVCLMVLSAGLAIEIYLLPHYVAPFTAAFYLIGIQALRHVRVWKPEGKPVGLTVVRLSVICCLVLAGLRMFDTRLGLAPGEWPPTNMIFTWFGPEHFGTERAAMERRLEQLPGGQLAIVRYAPDHYFLDEWVYNAADIDASKVIWARDMDPANNLELMKYYRGRTVWLVEPDVVPARITPYPLNLAASAK